MAKVVKGYIIEPGADLSGADLSDADLSNTNLNGITSGGIIGTPVLPAYYKLVDGYIIGPNVDLNGADLSNANLIGVTSGGITGTPILPTSYKLKDGNLMFKGKVGADVTPEEAYQAARGASINALAVIGKTLGDFSKVKRIVKITGYVSSAEGFTAQAGVLNGASDIFFEVFGNAGKHARVAVGVAVLPADSPVEIEVIAEIEV